MSTEKRTSSSATTTATTTTKRTTTRRKVIVDVSIKFQCLRSVFDTKVFEDTLNGLIDVPFAFTLALTVTYRQRRDTIVDITAVVSVDEENVDALIVFLESNSFKFSVQAQLNTTYMSPPNVDKSSSESNGSSSGATLIIAVAVSVAVIAVLILVVVLIIHRSRLSRRGATAKAAGVRSPLPQIQAFNEFSYSNPVYRPSVSGSAHPSVSSDVHPPNRPVPPSLPAKAYHTLNGDNEYGVMPSPSSSSSSSSSSTVVMPNPDDSYGTIELRRPSLVYGGNPALTDNQSYGVVSTLADGHVYGNVAAPVDADHVYGNLPPGYLEVEQDA